MIRLSNFAYLVLLSHHLFLAQIGSTRGFALFPKFPVRDGKALNASNSESFELVPLPKKVAVAGATGRTGRLVVEELLKRDIDVVALVRDLKKAKETLPTDEVGKLTVKVCDFSNKNELLAAVSGCDAALWCATGFSDAPGSNIIDKLQKLFTAVFIPKQSIDAIGVPALAEAMESNDESSKAPKVVMLSSAGVTRPSWSESKKEKFIGCADIPIVRLNPFGILDVKAASEERLRQSGTNYCIVRPCGLNDKQPIGARPVFSQGDVAVGRINRADVAKVMVDVLTVPEATGKTFEVFTLRGFPPASSISRAMSQLKHDRDPITEDALATSYSLLQQLLPGETQDAAALAMGQTYEQLDKNEVGRLGVRGKEDAEAAAPKPSS